MDNAQTILAPLQIPNNVKADAWDAYTAAKSTDDLTSRLQKLPLANNVKADLWDLKQKESAAVPAGYQPHNYGLAGPDADGVDHDSIGYKIANNPVVNAARDFVKGGGAGLASTATGAYNLVRKIPGADQILPAVSPEVQQATQAPDSLAGKAGKYTEQAAEFFAPVGEAAKVLEAAHAPLAARLAGEAAATAGVTGVQTGGDTQAMGAAGLTAGAVGAVGRGVGAVAKKVVPMIRRGGPIPAAQQEVLDLAQQHGVRDLTYGDVTGSPLAQKGESIMESIPVVGLSGLRERQQIDVKAAAQAVADKLKGTLATTPFADIHDVAQVAAGQGEGAQKAQDLLDLLHNAGDDPDNVTRASMGLQNFRTAQRAKELYDQVGAIADQKAPGPVSLENTMAALNRSISELGAAKLATPEGNRMVALFNGLKKNIRDGVGVTAGPGDLTVQESPAEKALRETLGNRIVNIDPVKFSQAFEDARDEPLAWNAQRAQNLQGLQSVDAYPEVAMNDDGKVDVQDGRHRIAEAAARGQSSFPVQIADGAELPKELVIPGTPNTYSGIRQLRQDLSAQIAQFYHGSNAVIGEKGVGYLQRVKDGVDRDLTQFASESGVPELAEAAKRADTYYRTERVPFKDRMISNAATTDEPDSIFSKFVQQGRGDRAQKFYNALDDKGRAAVRYGLVDKAIQKSTDEASGIFSPKKFVAALDKQQAAAGVFFQGKDKFELDGFKKLLAHTTRAGQYAENPPTGQRTIPLLMGGGAFAHPLLALKGLALTGAARVMMATPKGRNFLLSASSLPVGSPAFDRLEARIIQQMQGAGARLATGDRSQQTAQLQ